MKPEAIAENVAPAAVAMSLFFVLGVWSAINTLRTKCKLYEVLFASAVCESCLQTAYTYSGRSLLYNVSKCLLRKLSLVGFLPFVSLVGKQHRRS